LRFSYEQLKSLQSQLAQYQQKPNQYAGFLLRDLVNEFVSSFPSLTAQRTYNEGFAQLYDQGFLNRNWTLAEFQQLNGEKLLDDVRINYGCKKRTEGMVQASESTRQLRCAMLLSLSTYLQRRTEGYIQKIVSNKYGGNKTFRHRRQKTRASKLNTEQITSFLQSLKTFSIKAYLIAMLQILGARRITEVLSLKVEDLDLPNKRVHFRILKGRGMIKEPIAIYLPDSVLNEMQIFVGDRKEGFLFTQQKGKNQISTSPPPTTKAQVAKLYQRGWKNVNIQISNKEERISPSNSTTEGSIPFQPKMIAHALRS